MLWLLSLEFFCLARDLRERERPFFSYEPNLFGYFRKTTDNNSSSWLKSRVNFKKQAFGVYKFFRNRSEEWTKMSEEIDKLRWGIGCLVGAALSYLLGEESRMWVKFCTCSLRFCNLNPSISLFFFLNILQQCWVAGEGYSRSSNKGFV